MANEPEIATIPHVRPGDSVTLNIRYTVNINGEDVAYALSGANLSGPLRAARREFVRQLCREHKIDLPLPNDVAAPLIPRVRALLLEE